MSFLREPAFFADQLLHGAADVGAFLPTSRFASRGLVSEAARHSGPKRIVEVGSGTGPITAEIVRIMGPDDRLVLCDINPDFIDYVRGRFEREPAFMRVRDQVEFFATSVTDLDEIPTDFIISALPFTRLGADLTRAILAKYRRMLKPEGVLTYIEYAYLRRLKDAFTGGEGSASQVVDDLLKEYEFRRDEVWRNMPPAWIHHVRFGNVAPEVALGLNPAPRSHHVQVGAFGMDTDAWPFIAGLGAMTWLLRRRGSKVAWALPLAAAGFAAWFLRDPARAAKPASRPSDDILAASDGRVLAVESIVDERFKPGDWVRISTFLGLDDVHINRAPIAGKVVRVLREAGGYAPANTPSAESNAAEFTEIEGAAGRRCVVAQRVGAIARRIVNRARPGALLARGEKFGLIRFGSRTDIYLPAGSAEILVQAGDAIVAGETIVARFR